MPVDAETFSLVTRNTALATAPETLRTRGPVADLGFDKKRSETRVVVAMSGGVDSSVVAAMLAEAGYDVVGVTLQLYDHGVATARKGACCAGRDILDARRVAERVGFPHYVLDYEDRFRESVVDDFADAYLAGATPVPCIRCNERVKFRDLLDTALELEADCLATGHYVRRIEGSSGPELHAGADPTRDQSYFLFATTRPQLDRLRFPLGHVGSKAETRALAARYGLPVAEKPDSQDICFVPNGNYATVIEKLRPGAAEPGDIVDLTGRVLGRHEGVIRYTVGQRRGLGIGGAGESLFVVRLDAAARRVVVGPRAALATRTVTLDGVNWLGDGAFTDVPAGGWEARVRVRSTRPPVQARIHPDGEARARVELLTAEEGVAPGQACVFYAPRGPRVLGGGWIAPHAGAAA
jgi:tRNA-uridine 2-sulfurtransferase